MSARAWIDPITNVIRPRRVVLRRDLRGFLVGPWPVHTIQPFLHELTHHWCFHSPVGLALALLRFRALRRLGQSDSSAVELFDEMLTVDVLLELIRPISEGLAIFAEYDMSPGSSSIVTTPMVWAAIALSDRDRLLDIATEDGSWELFSRLLDLRLHPESLARKMQILSRPITTLDQAYFDGYMVVKRLYLDLSERVPAFADTDLFLSYIRNYLFEDYGLVRILAWPDANTFHRQVELIEYFGKRLQRLYRPELADDVLQFEDFNNRPPNSPRFAAIPGLDLTNEDLEAGLKIEGDLLNELEDLPGSSETMRQIRDVQRGWISRRSLAYIAAEPARVQVLNGVVSAWPDPADFDYPLITGSVALEGVADTKGMADGWVSLVLQPQTGIFVAVVGIGHETATIHWPPAMGEPDAATVAFFADPENSPIVVEEQHRAISDWVNGYFRNAPEPISTWVAEARQSTRGALKRTAEAFFRRWGPDLEAALAILTSKNRLWDLFESDRGAFEAFVAFGTMRPLDVLQPTLSKALSERGWSASEALTRALALEQKGVSFVRNDQGVFRWLV